jgi:putative membrane protein
MITTESESGKEMQLDRTQLALDRTWLAHERTLMAWARTATSMISFGFAIYKFFQLEVAQKGSNYGFVTPREFALIMISIGMITLLLATVTRRKESRDISTQLGRGRGSLAELVACLIFLFGILVFLATVVRG